MRDRRRVLSRAAAREVYDGFARTGHIGGKDAGSGYGGPAVSALISMALLAEASTVFEFGCGQAKLAGLVLPQYPGLSSWRAVDQSPLMCERARERARPFGARFAVEHLPSGDPAAATLPAAPVDRFISTYVLDLLSEDDMLRVLELARRALHPERGLLLLSGITWGWRDSPRTCLTTALWSLVYRVKPRVVGGCRPQRLEPYLKAKGWTVVRTARTRPTGFPWMMSEVICARPPPPPPP